MSIQRDFALSVGYNETIKLIKFNPYGQINYFTNTHSMRILNQL